MKFAAGLFSSLAMMLLAAGPAQAQSPVTFVSATGSDSNPCSRTAPCLSFFNAVQQTAINGEINCLDAGNFGSATIYQSITIDCQDLSAGVLYNGQTGFIMDANSFSSDVRKSVRLRNLKLNGLNLGNGGVVIQGATTGVTVVIEDCVIEGNFIGNARGIDDQRSGGGKLIVTNTTIRNNGGAGVSVLPRSWISTAARSATTPAASRSAAAPSRWRTQTSSSTPRRA